MSPSLDDVRAKLHSTLSEVDSLLTMVEHAYSSGVHEILSNAALFNGDELLPKRVDRLIKRFSYWQMGIPLPPQE